jgi:hypothetical protein
MNLDLWPGQSNQRKIIEELQKLADSNLAVIQKLSQCIDILEKRVELLENVMLQDRERLEALEKNR